MADERDPLVLTLALDRVAQNWLDELRRAHFPPERNLVPAHVTLFHALPGRELAAVRSALSLACAEMAAAPVLLGPPRFLGRGVALAVTAPTVSALRSRLALLWRDWLTAQDQQAWRPHVTVQNKVAPDTARALHEVLTATLAVHTAEGQGLQLWHYRGGPWEPAARFAFGAGG